MLHKLSLKIVSIFRVIYLGNAKKLDSLIKSGADVNARLFDGVAETILIEAIVKGILMNKLPKWCQKH